MAPIHRWVRWVEGIPLKIFGQTPTIPVAFLTLAHSNCLIM